MFAADLSSGEQKKEERVPRAFGKEVPIYFAVFCSCVFIVFVGGNVWALSVAVQDVSSIAFFFHYIEIDLICCTE